MSRPSTCTAPGTTRTARGRPASRRVRLPGPGGLRARARSDTIRRAPWPPSGLLGSTHEHWRCRRTCGANASRLLSRRLCLRPMSRQRLRLLALLIYDQVFCGSYASLTPGCLRCWSAIQPLSRANRAQASPQAKISNKIRLRFTDCRLVAARRQAQFAPAWTAWRLPGGDIFLDLLSTDTRNCAPADSLRQITTHGASGSQPKTR